MGTTFRSADERSTRVRAPGAGTTPSWQAAGSRLAVFALLVAALLSGSAFRARAGEEQKPPLRVAVLDLQAPAASPWLGPAVSEALAFKLAGLDGVTLIEREEVQAVLLAKRGQEPSAALLGADVLITGSIQLVGTWPDETAPLRLATKALVAETATHGADAAAVVDGTLGKLFALESDLADALARSMGLEPDRQQIDYREERSAKAVKLFGEGLIALQQAEAQTTAGAAPAEVQPALQRAAQLFRQAQQANEGAFFGRAHLHETRARELLAQTQRDDDQRRQVRQATIKQFRQDAADAAPAFLDLGRALEASREHREAITAYEQFLQWIDEPQKTLLFSLPCKSDLNAGFRIDGQDLFSMTHSEILKTDVDTGEIRWRANIRAGHLTQMAFTVGRQRVFVNQSDNSLLVLDRSTGRPIATIPYPEEHAAVVEGHVSQVNLVASHDEQYVAVLRDYLSEDERLRRTAGLYVFSVQSRSLKHYLPEIRHLFPLSGRWVVVCRREPLKPREGSLQFMDLDSGRFEPLPGDELTVDPTSLCFLPNQPAVLFLARALNAAPGPGSWHCLDLRLETVAAASAPGRTSVMYRSDDPSRIWSGASDRVLELREAASDRLLWRYQPPGFGVCGKAADGRILLIGRTLEQYRNRLYAYTHKGLLCVSIPSSKRVPKRQLEAWIAIGRNRAALAEYEAADAAFRQSEIAQCYNPDLYWEWASALSTAPASTKKRFRLLERFLQVAGPSDPRRTRAQAEGRMLSGLRHVIPGSVLCRDGRPVTQEEGYIIRGVERRHGGTSRERFALVDAFSGDTIWQQPHAGPDAVSSLAPTWVSWSEDHLTALEERNRALALIRIRLKDGSTTRHTLASSDPCSAVGSVCHGWQSPWLHRHLVVRDGLLSYNRRGRTVSLVSSGSGEPQWSRNLLGDGERIERVLMSKEEIYIFIGRGRDAPPRLIKLRAQDGSVLWKRESWPPALRQWSASTCFCQISGQALLVVEKGQTEYLRIRLEDGAVAAAGLEHPAELLVRLLSGAAAISCTGDDSGSNRTVVVLDDAGQVVRTLNDNDATEPAACLSLPATGEEQALLLGIRRMRSLTARTADGQRSGQAVLFHAPGAVSLPCWLAYDAQNDQVLVYVSRGPGGGMATCVFDRKKLGNFLLQPGE